MIVPVTGNLSLSDGLKWESWKEEDEGTEAQPRTRGFNCQHFDGEPGMLWAVKCFCFTSSGLCSQALIEAVISARGNGSSVFGTPLWDCSRGRVLPGSFES